MAAPELTFDAARDAVRALVSSLDGENASLLADLERVKRDTAGDTVAFMAQAMPIAMQMAAPTLSAAGFDTTSPVGLMAFVAQVQQHETAQAAAAGGGGAAAGGGGDAAFSADVARVRALLLPPTMTVPDGMAAKRAAMDARMKARRAKAEAKAAARKAKKQ